VEVGGKRQVIRFPVEDSQRDAFGAIPEAVIRDIRPESKSGSIQDAKRILIEEAKRAASAHQ
jgi:hypothetical protein